MSKVELWVELNMLNAGYVNALDNGHLEDWPKYFTEDCFYEIVPKENADSGLPIGLIYCTNQRMLRDRVTSLREANIYEEHTYRHLLSGLEFVMKDDGSLSCESNYVVVQTRSDGMSLIYQAGRYLDKVVRTSEGLRFKERRVIYDTLRVQTLLATPI